MRKYIFAIFTVAVIAVTTLTVSVSTFAQSGTGGTGGTGPTSDLIGHWTFDDGTATDSSGNGNDGVVNGAVPTVGRIGAGALDFRGLSDHVDLGGLDAEGSAVTVAAWFNSDNLANCSSSDCRIFSKASGSAEQDHYIMVSTIRTSDGPKLRFRLKAGGSTDTLIASTGALSNATWYHVAATYDGAFMRLYLDGVEVRNAAKTGAIATDPAVSTWIGGNPPTATSRPWDGKIDDVRLYRTALSQSEIQELADPQVDPNEFLYWADTDIDSLDIKRLRLSDLTLEVFASTGVMDVSGIDVASEIGRVFWTDNTVPHVRSAALDGAGVEFLDDVIGQEIAVDEANGLYFYGAQPNIVRADLDNSNRQVILGPNGQLSGLAVDPANQHVYWSRTGVGISRVGYNGANPVPIISDPGWTGQQIAVDPVVGKLYAADPQGIGGGRILRSNLDGTGVEDLITGVDSGRPLGIDLDLVAGKIYWSSRDASGIGELRRANLDGTNVETLLTGLAGPSAVALGAGAPIVPQAPLPPSAVNTVEDTANITVTFGGTNDTVTTSRNQFAVIQLTGLGTTFPIAGAVTDVENNTVISTDGGVTNLLGAEFDLFTFFSGNSSGDPFFVVRLTDNGAPFVINHISYQTSAAPPNPGVVVDDVAATLDLSGVFATSVIAVSDPSKTVTGPVGDIKVFLDAGGGTKGTQIVGQGGTGQAVVLKVNTFGTHLLIESQVSTGGPTTDVIVEYMTGP